MAWNENGRRTTVRRQVSGDRDDPRQVKNQSFLVEPGLQLVENHHGNRNLSESVARQYQHCGKDHRAWNFVERRMRKSKFLPHKPRNAGVIKAGRPDKDGREDGDHAPVDASNDEGRGKPIHDRIDENQNKGTRNWNQTYKIKFQHT